MVSPLYDMFFKKVDDKMNQRIIELEQEILEIRYIDIEKEKTLCLELLDYGTVHNDSYVKAFAYTFLGDYFIVQNDMSKSIDYLKKAKELIDHGKQWEQLSVYIYMFLGIVYEILSDQQNCINSFLEAIQIARRIHDKKNECIVLNNLAYTFYQHGSYKIALEYFEKAYKVSKKLNNKKTHRLICCNLGDLKLHFNCLEEAKELYQECENIETNDEMSETYHCRNSCCYFAAKGNQKEARYWAKRVLNDDNIISVEDFGAFETYRMLCEAMLKVKDKECSYSFLQLMKKNCSEGLQQRQVLEEKRMEYSILFDNEEEQSKNYLRFYNKTRELKGLINKEIVETMKEKIYLDELIQQKKKLQQEQRSLEKEANLDEITQVYNRRSLDAYIKEYSHMIDRCLGVIMVDVDYFKEYNDYYGHVEGDKVLYEVASCLKANQKEGITYYRFGGDEFICLCVDLTSEVIEEYIKEVQNDLFKRPIPHLKSPLKNYITLSFGYANYVVNKEFNIHNLMQLADEALYDSKINGRNTYRKK